MQDQLAGDLRVCPLCGGPVLVELRGNTETIVCSNPKCMQIRAKFSIPEPPPAPPTHARTLRRVILAVCAVCLLFIGSVPSDILDPLYAIPAGAVLVAVILCLLFIPRE